MKEEINNNIKQKILFYIKDNNFKSAENLILKALKKFPKSLFLNMSLANTMYAQDKYNESIKIYNEIILMDPNNAEAYLNIGNSYNELGNFNEAIKFYTLANEKDKNLLNVNYNMGMTYYQLKKIELALKHFKELDNNLSLERLLQCQYQLKLYEEFNQNLEKISNNPHTSRLVASLSSHAETNLRQENKYNFCKNPLEFIYKEKIDSDIISELKKVIRNIEVNYRNQGLLYNGIQSSGNIFESSNPIFTTLKFSIYRVIENYREKFNDKNCEFIQKWPKKDKIKGWFVKMKKDGFLKPHIHEIGWLSGVIYLKVPEKIENQGMIKFGLDGHNYPKLHENFPSKIEEVSTNDIVVFPSSLFHQTIPFESEEERICIAFDINP
jgi:tetratricopeptide (TPR) repeat protein